MSATAPGGGQMSSTSSYQAYERRRAVIVVVALAGALALGIVLAPQIATNSPTAAQLNSNLAKLWLALVVLFVVAGVSFWRLGNKERELLVTMPPEGPEPPPLVWWRYVRRRDRPAFFQTVAVVLAICAAGLSYFAWQIEALLSR